MSNASEPLSGRILLAAFEGWSDAGNAASGTLEWLGELLDVDVLHTIGSDGYIDLQVHRPRIALTDDGTREVLWPETNLYGPVARPDRSELLRHAPGIVPDLDESAVVHDLPGSEAPDAEADTPALRPVVNRISGEPASDLFLLVGVEPSRNWQAFAEEVVEIAEGWAIDTVILLGSLFSDSPHSRPITTQVTSEHPVIRAKIGASRSDYEGPIGVSTVIGLALEEAGVPVVSLWAQVPHYVHSAPSPKATLALIDQLEELLDIVVPRGELVEQSNDWEHNINRIAEADEDMAQYIQRLEEARDAVEAPEATGDAIAYEFQKFLQEPARDDAEAQDRAEQAESGEPGDGGEPGTGV
ncbi:proteasome assembly chaperone family protein [Leucobacter sp. M11]|uniref:proteasome assembly chaperone family protein n=1 Tax=Leucobacter sp. M11 TaxID=2993565 RepID=UPI002D7E2AF2|nr:PAC2 family protein [Leucobacter sp. M11]MEB4616318.1 PAC2 family protein [Leucobacter sp. M11]